MNILELAKSYQREMVEHRRYLHMNAEIGHDLPLTTAYVTDKLIEMGYNPEVICEGGIVAIADGGNVGKTILLRGDMDALPIKEEVECDYKSTTDNMHACGHDLHTAMMLGAAKILKEHESELCGRVKLMFQPAEEVLTGAKAMINAGVLDNPKVDAAIMIHVFSGMPTKNRAVVFMPVGVTSASSDAFKISVKGKGGHGAMPNTTIDPLNILAHTHIALGEINSREIQPGETAVVTLGEMHGGNAPNIIPDKAYMCGTIRAYDKDVRAFLNKRVREIATGVATTFRGEVEIESLHGCPSVINDEELYNKTLKYTTELLGEENVCELEKLYGKMARMSGSEDFGYLSERVPSLMLALSSSEKDEDGKIYPQHHPKVRFDEDSMYIGASVYANTAIQWLKEM